MDSIKMAPVAVYSKVVKGALAEVELVSQVFWWTFKYVSSDELHSGLMSLLHADISMRNSVTFLTSSCTRMNMLLKLLRLSLSSKLSMVLAPARLLFTRMMVIKGM
jgi:hypothetical protein